MHVLVQSLLKGKTCCIHGPPFTSHRCYRGFRQFCRRVRKHTTGCQTTGTGKRRCIGVVSSEHQRLRLAPATGRMCRAECRKTLGSLFYFSIRRNKRQSSEDKLSTFTSVNPAIAKSPPPAFIPHQHPSSTHFSFRYNHTTPHDSNSRLSSVSSNDHEDLDRLRCSGNACWSRSRKKLRR